MDFRRPATAVAIFLGAAAPLAIASTASGAPPKGYRAVPAAFAAHNLCAPPTDTVGPVATKVTFGRASVGLNGKNRTQSVTVTASDTSGRGEPSGVEQVSALISGPRFWASVRLKRTSGTATSGNWTGHFTVSKYAHPGTYSLGDLYVVDRAGNVQDYDGYGKVAYSPNSLTLNPADNPHFAVTGTPATRPPRKHAATLTGFTLSPSHVDTTHAAHYVHFTARFSGPAPQRVYVYLQTERKDSGRYVWLHAVLHDHHGVWTASLRVPRWLGKQSESLQPQLTAQWTSRYTPTYREYSADRLGELHFANKVTLVSGVDRTKPVLTGLSFSPHVVDSTTGSVRLTFTGRVHDTGSGVRSIDVEGSIRNGANGSDNGVYPFAAAGVGYISSNYFEVRLTKGSDGRWTGSTTIRRCVPSGTYKLQASAVDFAGNYHGYSTGTLAKDGLPSTVKITSKHGDVAAPYVYSAATYGADSEVFLNFSEGVKNVDTSTLTVFPLSPAKTRFTKPSTITSIVCANGKTKVDCSGSAGLITSAVLTVPDLTPGQEYEVYANLRQVTTQLTDGNNNPLGWNYAATQVKDS